jgi:hypothetical protein
MMQSMLGPVQDILNRGPAAGQNAAQVDQTTPAAADAGAVALRTN